MAEGQRLRWWQDDEERTNAAREASKRVAITPTPLLPETAAMPAAMAEHSEPQTDTWAELEAEAARRVAQASIDETKSLSFYTDKAALLTRYRRLRRATSPLIIGLMLMNFLFAAFMVYQVSSLYQMYTLAHENLQLPLFVFFTHQKTKVIRLM